MKEFFICLVLSCWAVKGNVVLMPANIIPVCATGSDIELICSVSQVALTWSFNHIPMNGVSIKKFPQPIHIQYRGENFLQNELVLVNGVHFNFSRLSEPDSFPVVSKLVIGPIDASFNGSEVLCTDSVSVNTSFTTIYVYNETGFSDTEVNVTRLSEMFEANIVSVYLMWNQISSSYSYKVTVVPEVEMMFNEGNQVHLTMVYNTAYNVNVIATHPCGNVTETFMELYYGSCRNPRQEIDNYDNGTVEVIGYRGYAHEGMNISISCSPGSSLSGPSLSTCTEYGQWEPDLRLVMCREFSNCAELEVNKMNQAEILRVVAITSTCTFLITSMVYVLGWTCVYTLKRRWKELHSGEIHPNNATVVYDAIALESSIKHDVQLNDNVAYRTIQAH